MSQFDIVFVGSGPAGYVGAIRASQLGMKVAIVEKEKELGGTCLNVGCIPSKALLDSSEHFFMAQNHFSDHGIETSSLSFSIEKMMGRKGKIVTELTGGIAFLMKKNKVTVLKGWAKFKDAQNLEVGDQTIQSKHFVLCTGSYPTALPFLPFDGKRVLSSTHALSLKEVPKKMAIIGGGVIGLEMGSIWNRLGTEVSVYEYSEQIGGVAMDAEVSKKLLKVLEKQGMKFFLNHGVTGGKTSSSSVSLEISPREGGDNKKENFDYVLVAIGRAPFTDKLNLEAAGVSLADRGFVSVNESNQTSQSHIWAVGDVVGGAMLAHKAEEEAVAVAERISTGYGHVSYDCIPSVVYTWPEVAWVGKSEEELKKESTEYKKGSFPLLANGRAKAMGEKDGFIKVLACAKTDKILGVHVLAPRGSDLIAEAVMAMEFSASSEDMARSMHGHPTLSEAMREAALGVENRVRQM